MENRVYVWDSLVRVFHWLLATAFVVSYLTGDENETIHVYSGYLILALILIRVVWGVIGSRRARFSDFVRPPSQAFQYLKDLLSGNARRYVGHNPAGGWMAVMLLVSLLLSGLSGLKLYGVEGHGPLAVGGGNADQVISKSDRELSREFYEDDDHDDHERDDHDEQYEDEHEEDEAEEFWEEIHEFFVNTSLFLVVLHLVGVLISSLSHRENLVMAMITGFKDKTQ